MAACNLKKETAAPVSGPRFMYSENPAAPELHFLDAFDEGFELAAA
jgi:hypothetical protein